MTETIVKTRRKTISDELINKDILTKLVNKVFNNAKDVYNINQTEIVRILLDYSVGNKTIARVINEVIPTAKATPGSVASLVKYIRNGNNLLDELLQELDEV